MYARVKKNKTYKSGAVANSATRKKMRVTQGFGFVDNRPDSVKLKRANLAEKAKIVQMVKIYPPSGNSAVIRTAEAQAQAAILTAGQRPHNTNADPKYVTADQSIGLKQAWLARPAMTINGVQFKRRASDSTSGPYVDLKLASSGGAAEFNCHVMIDYEEIKKPVVPKEKEMDTMKRLYQQEKKRAWPY